MEVCPSSATSDILGEQPDIPMGQGAHPMWGVPPPQPPSHTALSHLPCPWQSWWEAAGALHSLQRYLKFPVPSHKGKNTHLQSLSPPVITNNCKSVIRRMFPRNISASHIPDLHRLAAGQGRFAPEACAVPSGRRAVPGTGPSSAPGPRSSHHAFLSAQEPRVPGISTAQCYLTSSHTCPWGSATPSDRGSNRG